MSRIRTLAGRIKSLAERIQGRWREDENGCWIWQGGTSAPGYGKVLHRGRMIGAHVASYLVHVGDIPDGLWVLHSCDVKLCGNPAHLRLGTQRENTEEAVVRGRYRYRWSDEVVRAVVESDGTQEEIAATFGVPMGTLSNWRCGRDSRVRRMFPGRFEPRGA